MDRDAIVRSRRRDQALEALEFEREREQALAHQLGSILVEEEGSRIDEQAFGRMAEADVALVRELLDDGGWAADEDGDLLEQSPEDWLSGDDGEPAEQEDEIGRLQGEIARCRERQQALERYMDALGA